MQLTAQAILNHPTYQSSNELVKGFTSPTFHHHYHVLLPILHLLNAKHYLELGTFAGGSMKVATQCPSLVTATGVDTFKYHSVERVKQNVGETRVQLTFHQSLTNNPETLRALYQNSTVVPTAYDVLFIDAGHRYQDVISDSNNYYALVKPGGVIVFDDYGDHLYSAEVKQAVDVLVKQHPELNVIGQLPNLAKSYGNKVPGLEQVSNEFIVQKPLPTIPGSSLTFGVVMATYNRGDHSRLAKSLQSLLAQSYPNWHLFLTGDHHTDLDELRKVIAMIPADKLTFTNLPLGFERDFTKDLKTLRNTGGATAMNYSLALMRHSGYRYMAHLDDDDIWLPHHLQTLAEQYQRDPTLACVYARGQLVRRGTLGRLMPGEIPKSESLPMAGKAYHSSISWDLHQVHLYYPTGNNYRGMAADAAALVSLNQQPGLKGYFCDQVTNLYEPCKDANGNAK